MIHSSRNRVLSQADVRISNAPVRVGDDRLAGLTTSDVKAGVSVQRDADGDVVEIHVRCACGELTVINCNYDG